VCQATLAHALAHADVVLALDWIDPAGTLAACRAGMARLINVSMDYAVPSGAADFQQLPRACA
jgi:hypothetical protein